MNCVGELRHVGRGARVDPEGAKVLKDQIWNILAQEGVAR
jgi:hypothetical protein